MVTMIRLSPSLCWPRRHWHSWVLEEPVLSHTYVLMHLHFLMKLLSTSLSHSLSLAKLHYAANITNDSADTPVGEEAKLAAPQRGTRPAKWAGRTQYCGGQQGTSNFPLNEACWHLHFPSFHSANAFNCFRKVPSAHALLKVIYCASFPVSAIRTSPPLSPSHQLPSLLTLWRYTACENASCACFLWVWCLSSLPVWEEEQRNTYNKKIYISSLYNLWEHSETDAGTHKLYASFAYSWHKTLCK